MSFNIDDYNKIRSGGVGYFEQKRGLIAVWGNEAVQFLDGMITNDMKTLEDGQQMIAAFPNAKGRLLAVVRVLRQGDRFLFETEEATREKVFQNLFRFTFAGDFFVEDISNQYMCTTIWNSNDFAYATYIKPEDRKSGKIEYRGEKWLALNSIGGGEVDLWIPSTQIQEYFLEDFHNVSGAINVSDGSYETLRIESGIPRYGIDMDENTIVPELGIDEMISYNKGCYVGQEIIARIHFRGHVAKRLTGLVLSESEAGTESSFAPGTELFSTEGKNAGKITSVTFSPKLNKTIALAYVRYEFLEEGTKLTAADNNVEVKNLPFII